MEVAKLKVSVDTSDLERAIALADEYIGKLERIAEMQSSERLDELVPSGRAWVKVNASPAEREEFDKARKNVWHNLESLEARFRREIEAGMRRPDPEQFPDDLNAYGDAS